MVIATYPTIDEGRRGSRVCGCLRQSKPKQGGTLTRSTGVHASPGLERHRRCAAKQSTKPIAQAESLDTGKPISLAAAG